LEWHSFKSTQDWENAAHTATFIPALLVGTVLVIVGAFFDRRRLLVARTRVRGILCWIASGTSFSLWASIGNVHGWTFAFILPAFAGFLTGMVLLSKSR
jgi:hypothetical protein